MTGPLRRLGGLPGWLRGEEPACSAGEQAQSLRQEGPLGEGMAPCSGFLTWEIPRTEDWWATVPGGTKESENNVATKQQLVCLGEDVKGMYRSQREAPHSRK